MPARSLPMKNRKTLARDVSGTIATYSNLVHGVIGTDYSAQNGTAHGRVFATFKRRFVCLYIKTRNQAKNCFASSFYSTPIDRSRDASLVCFPFKIQPLQVSTYLVLTRLPGDKTVGESGLCSCVPCYTQRTCDVCRALEINSLC